MNANPTIVTGIALAWLLTGCQEEGKHSPQAAPTKVAATAQAKPPNAEPAKPKLHGQAPPEAKRTQAPAFAASNRDGEPRSQADLLGHPTILWFYPKASTPG